MILYPKAMDIYESHAQEFLQLLLVLCHIPGGPPLRASELLSMMWCNTARQRHLFIWEKLLMIYAKLDGTVWVNKTLSACLRKACTRVKVPCLHTSNWRQFAASITKEKFSTKEQANFDIKESVGEDIEDELDLVALAEQSNYSYHTFNHAYTGTTTLTISALLHRNYRASESWHTLFRLDYILQGKRLRGASETLGAYSEADLLAVARKLYNKPDLQFRVPGQRNSVLAIMGPYSAE
ncbi:telomere-associated putative RecQ-like protein usher [Cadophora sp. MPI-SDFR-AT-0126]|nr:telomere-associated putative RecQ-like protein usher [Leotiomycetes sp. MPI-SDFR-AT-0126]KAH7417738.1 telomere-associated putative RecQ-like protein usher [Leotiomycetes sp. MPI-SDFR-AT-0126]